MDILAAMSDPMIFGSTFGAESWKPWRTLLGGFYGLEVEDPGLWRELTQRDIPTEPHSELWLPLGRRAGKSHVSALVCVYEAAFSDHSERLSAGEKATVALLAGSRLQARHVARFVKGLLENSPILSRMVYRYREESVELNNDTIIEVLPANYRSIRGYSLAAVVCDEISFWVQDGKNPDVEVLTAIRPALSTLRGRLLAISTPYARRGAMWESYRRYFGKEGDVLVAQATSLTMNPTLSPAVVQRAYEEDAIAAASEFGAAFRTDIEAFLTVEIIEACTRQGPLELLPESGLIYHGFCDPSGGSSDSMTLCVAHRDPQTGVAVIDAIRRAVPKFSPEAVTADFCQLLKTYRIYEVSGDAYSGEIIREIFRKNGVSYRKSDKNKSQLYTDLLALANSGKVEFPADKVLHRELLGLERRTSRGGRDSIDHGPNQHDDVANAVAGAATLAASRPVDCRPYLSQIAGL